MFTFKKLALVGVAGLAAFAMSCSDSDSDEAGTWTGFEASVDSEGDVRLKGVIKAEDGVVSSLSATVEGKNVTLFPTTIRTPNVASVSLTDAGAYIDKSDACTAAAGATSIKVKVTATIESSAVASPEKTVTINCGGGGLSTTTFTLGWNSPNLSCVDIDTGTPISLGSSANPIPVANKVKIDMCAYTTGATDNKIYSPWDIEALYAGRNSNTGAYEGSDVVAVYDISSSYSALNSATSPAGIPVAALQAVIASGVEISEDGLTITASTAVLVETSELGTFAVLVTNAGSGVVTFKAINVTELVD
jgi:hypothetical protein